MKPLKVAQLCNFWLITVEILLIHYVLSKLPPQLIIYPMNQFLYFLTVEETWIG